MKTTFPSVLCLCACLCGCAGAGRVTENQPPPEDKIGWWQRTDRFAGGVRDNLARAHLRIQDVVEIAADSDVVTCLVPGIVVAAYVVAFFAGSGGGIGFGSVPAPLP